MIDARTSSVLSRNCASDRFNSSEILDRVEAEQAFNTSLDQLVALLEPALEANSKAGKLILELLQLMLANLLTNVEMLRDEITKLGLDGLKLAIVAPRLCLVVSNLKVQRSSLSRVVIQTQLVAFRVVAQKLEIQRSPERLAPDFADKKLIVYFLNPDEFGVPLGVEVRDELHDFVDSFEG